MAASNECRALKFMHRIHARLMDTLSTKRHVAHGCWFVTTLGKSHFLQKLMTIDNCFSALRLSHVLAMGARHANTGGLRRLSKDRHIKKKSTRAHGALAVLRVGLVRRIKTHPGPQLN